MAANLSNQLISSALQHSAPGIERALSQAASKPALTEAECHLQQADQFIRKATLKKYQSSLVQHPISGDQVTLSRAVKAGQEAKSDIETTQQSIHYAAQKLIGKRNHPQKSDIQAFIKDEMAELQTKKVNLQKARAAQPDFENQAASVIQRHWRQQRGRPALLPSTRQNIREELRIAKGQTEQFAETGTIGYTQKLSNGFMSDSSRYGGAFNQERLLVDAGKDGALRNFLKSEPVRQLQGKLPNAQSTREAEIAFLNQAKQVINDHYGKVAPRDSLALYEKLGAQNPNYNPNGIPVLLGTTLEAGAGVCRQRSLTGKVMFDELGVPSSLHSGSVHNNTSRPGDHAWNQVKMPSGREYLFDAMHNKIIDLSQPETRQLAQASYKTLAEL